MSKFIEVTKNQGGKELINTSTISSVQPTNNSSGCTIYFISPSVTNTLSIAVKESYSEMKELLTTD